MLWEKYYIHFSLPAINITGILDTVQTVAVVIHETGIPQITLKVYLACLSIYLGSTMFRKRFPKLDYLLEVILFNFTFILILPLIITVALFLILFRTLLNTYLRVRHNGKVKLMSNKDAFWACDSHLNADYIYVMGFIKGDCILEKRKNKLKRMFQLDHLLGSDRFDRLKCKIVNKFGFMCWEKYDKFDPRECAQYLIKEDPFKPLTEEDLLAEIGKNYDYPMPDDEPKWKLFLAPNFIPAEGPTSEKNYAIVWKMNHAYMDGLSLNNVTSWLFIDEPVPMTLDPFKPFEISTFHKLLMYTKLLLLGPHSLLKSLMVKEEHCFHGPKTTGPKRLGISRPIDLNALKNIKTATNGTSITSLLNTGIGGAMRRLALKKGAEVPDTIGIAVTAAIFPYEGLTPCNKFTMALMPMRIGSGDIKTRLESSAKSAFDLSRSVDFLVFRYIVNFVGLFPNNVIDMVINNSHSTMVLSNVPGPRMKFYLEGRLVTDIICYNVIKGFTGLGICLYSYGGFIRAGVVGDACIFPDPTDFKSFLEEFEGEIGDIAEFAGVPRSSLFRK